MSKNKMSFKEAMLDFESTVNKLMNSDLSIDEAIAIHEEGLKKCKICEDILNDASQKIEIYKKEQEIKQEN